MIWKSSVLLCDLALTVIPIQAEEFFNLDLPSKRCTHSCAHQQRRRQCRGCGPRVTVRSNYGPMQPNTHLAPATWASPPSRAGGSTHAPSRDTTHFFLAMGKAHVPERLESSNHRSSKDYFCYQKAIFQMKKKRQVSTGAGAPLSYEGHGDCYWPMWAWAAGPASAAAGLPPGWDEVEDAEDEVDEPWMTRSSQGSTLEWLWSGVEVSRPGRRKEPSSSEADDVSVVKITTTGVM